ncbi:methyltransferase [Sphingomonas nostoxanthinifaciens]|uniref:methyltransferase n=1 Tax=Sphingomonas nostoxanthinifaciens TaxID=2872652 RepID=UPI001CC1D0BC|nr:methyltransferase [Sphingomonas nostoxanthinifaciens]UAK26788.1 methyltransferase [Sphingomonas nostoxanthinifaciens]
MLPRHAAAFGRADRYDAHAHVQARVAEWLAGALPPLDGRRVLEIGCGTGLLRDRARPTGGDWLMTDIAPAMVARAAARFAPQPGVRFACLDAERPRFEHPEAPFDLIVGSLVVQWFDDLAGGLAALRGLLAPGGRMLLTTLARGTFAEWRAAHHGTGRIDGVRDYPDAAQLAGAVPVGMAATVTIRDFRDDYADARGFLAGLKGIGAATPRADHRPLAPATLRRVMRRFEASGSTATYVVGLLDLQEPAA